MNERVVFVGMSRSRESNTATTQPPNNNPSPLIGERMRLLHDTLEIFTTLVTDPLFADTEIAYVSRTGGFGG
jgi:hypothetical protein